MKIKINRVTPDARFKHPIWYSKYIGKIFEVKDHGDHYRLKDKDYNEVCKDRGYRIGVSGLAITKDDCELIN